MNALAAAACAGLAAWCSLGALGLMPQGTADARVALLPPWWLLPVFVVGALTAIRLARLSREQISPLFGLAVVLLPWLPFPVPPAALLWTGVFTFALWVVVLVSVVRLRWPRMEIRALADASRAPYAAAALALMLYGASAWWLSPILPEGDGPHYLIIAQSLITDGDLQIENNHARGDYLGYSLTAAAPAYLRRGVNGAIYSIHAPGLPAIVAPVMAAFGYPGVVAFLGLIAALSTGLVWRVAYRATGSAEAAWFGWASCSLTTPFFFQATQVFPDGFAATCVLLGTLPLLTSSAASDTPEADRSAATVGVAGWMLSGTALAILPWLHPRLSIIAAAVACCLAVRIRRVRHAVSFAAVPAASAAGLFAFFYMVYGTPDPRAAFASDLPTMANTARGLPALLFDQQFGLVANAPVYLFVMAGLLRGLVTRRRWSWELLIQMLPYIAVVGGYQMWWGGTSVPARLITPVTLVLGLGAARAWHHARRRATRQLAWLALAASVLVTMALLGPGRGRLLFNFRDGVALWLEWANDLVDLPKAAPSIFADGPSGLLAKSAVWAGMLLVAWLVLRVTGDARGEATHASSPSATTIWCAAVAVMVACTLGWRLHAAQPLTPATAEIGLLRQARAWRPLAYDYGGRRFTAAAELLSHARIRTDHQRRTRDPEPVLWASRIPPGTYRPLVTARSQVQGTLTLRVGDTRLPFWTAPAPAVPQRPGNWLIPLPFGARSLAVEGDEATARSIATFDLEPVEASAAANTSEPDGAHRGARYAAGDAFFLDENAYAEPTGFWVAGGRVARLGVTYTGAALQLFLRNAPVGNVVTIDVGTYHEEITFAPGEERVVTLPAGLSGAVARIRARSGFRPSQANPGSRDQRYLGCWVEFR